MELRWLIVKPENNKGQHPSGFSHFPLIGYMKVLQYREGKYTALNELYFTEWKDIPMVEE